MAGALKASLGDATRVEIVVWTDTLGMRTRLVVEPGWAAALTASRASLRSSFVLPFVRLRIFIFLK